MKLLALVGASGHGKVIADIALATGWDKVIFFDDRWPDIKNNEVWEVAGTTQDLLSAPNEFQGALVSIGNCNIRWNIHKQLEEKGHNLATIIHPSAIISPYSKVGKGTIIMPAAILNAYATVGDSCIINTGAIVEHDCKIDNAVHIAPSVTLSGNVTIGPNSWFGVGATARQGATIGSNVTVGAGAVVIKDIEDNLIVTGCPAAPLRL